LPKSKDVRWDQSSKRFFGKRDGFFTQNGAGAIFGWFLLAVGPE
jgi:hypothetical protein